MVAKQLEALSNYKSIGVKDTQIFYVMGQGTIDPVARSDNKPTSQLDADRDVNMTSVNAFATKKPNKRHQNTSQKDYGNQLSMPRAPWRSKDEFRRLTEKGFCVRCCKPGNFARGCALFRAAVRPDSEINAVEVDDNDRNSGNEKHWA
ncbi:hypothetical protein K3495_g11792 [Podosphaera aphanis]|nr:hypothetical protein K3495_g11792 [Podosphaera aphanis]